MAARQETSPQDRRQGLGEFAERQKRAQQQEQAEQQDDQNPLEDHGPFHLTRREVLAAAAGSFAALAVGFGIKFISDTLSHGEKVAQPKSPNRAPAVEKPVNTETPYSMFSKRLRKDTDPEFWAQVAKARPNPLGVYNFNTGGGVRRRNIYLEKKDLENDRVNIRIRVDGDGSFFANDAIAAKNPTVDELKELAKKVLLNPPDDSVWDVGYTVDSKQNPIIQIVGITTNGNTTTVFKVNGQFLIELEEKPAAPILIAQTGEKG